MLKSILLLQVASILGRILFFLFSVAYINRSLGIEAKGAWTGIFALFSILSVCSNMGFEVWLSRGAAAGTVSAQQAWQFLLKVKTPLWAACLTIGAVKVWSGGHEVALALPFAMALVFDGLGVAWQAIYEGRRKIGAMALLSFLKSGGFAFFALGMAYVLGPVPLSAFAWLFAAMLFLRAVLGRRSLKLLPSDGPPLPPGTWHSFLTMGAYTMVTVLYFKIDAVMLSDMAGDVVTGNYGNAYDLVEGALFVSAAAGSVLYPRLVANQGDARARLFDCLFRFILTIGACGIAGFWIFGEPVGRFLGGDAFAGAIPPLAILAMGLPFMFANGLLSRWLFSEHRERFALLSATALAIFNITGNYLIIPQYGAEGASVMTLATEGLLFLVWILFGRRKPRLLVFWLGLMIPIALIGLFQWGGAGWAHLVAGVILLMGLLGWSLQEIREHN